MLHDIEPTVLERQRTDRSATTGVAHATSEENPFLEFTNSSSAVRLSKAELLSHSRELTAQIARWENVPWIAELKQSESPILLKSNLYDRGRPIALTKDGFRIPDYDYSENGSVITTFHSMFNRNLRVQVTLDGLSLKIVRESLQNRARERGIDPNVELKIDEKLLSREPEGNFKESLIAKSYLRKSEVPDKCLVEQIVRDVGVLKRPASVALERMDENFAQNLSKLLDSEGTRYVKPSDMHAGRGIFTVTRTEGGEYRFQSNCGIVCMALHGEKQPRMTKIVNAVRDVFCWAYMMYKEVVAVISIPVPAKTAWIGAATVIVPSRQDAVKLATEIMRNIGGNRWIVEDKIPIESIWGKRREFRLVFEKYSDNEPLGLRGHYVKCSRAAVTGNISTFGHGETTDRGLDMLVNHRWGKLSTAERREQSNHLKNELIDVSERFLDRFIAAYAPEAGMKGTLAVDVAPAWNERKHSYDWYLIELNSGSSAKGSTVGISGMKGNKFFMRNVRDAGWY